ncbi:MAG: NYN domain-containing protein [Pirellulales bacterium]|nr:NYN domain-containing protein [Pirellulales bacterium]
MPVPPPIRSIVYIDGFNLYYGALKNTAHKWLDLETLFRRLLPNDDVQRIYYFSAKVTGDAGRRQQRYLDALATLPLVTVVLGRYKEKQIKCRQPECTFQGNRHFKAMEEKRTDVNIAVQMMDDAFNDRCNRFVVVSGDSDLVPPIARIKDLFPKKRISVYVPATNAIRGAAVELRGIAHKDRLLPNNLIERCQLPHRIADGSGGWIEKPTEW